jgi:hypothetical protein
MYVGLHVKYLLFVSDFNQTWIFSTDFRTILKYIFLWKSFHWSWFPCWWTDVMKQIVTFCSVASVPKNWTPVNEYQNKITECDGLFSPERVNGNQYYWRCTNRMNCDNRLHWVHILNGVKVSSFSSWLEVNTYVCLLKI